MTDPRIAIEVQADTGSVRLVVVGEIDPHTSPELDAAWRAAVAGPGEEGAAVIFDLAGVTFIDSSGLRVLIGANQALSERSGTVVIDRPSATVAKLLEVTQLSAEFDIRGA